MATDTTNGLKSIRDLKDLIEDEPNEYTEEVSEGLGYLLEMMETLKAAK